MLALEVMSGRMESMLLLEVMHKSGVDVARDGSGVGPETTFTSGMGLGGTNFEPMLAGADDGTNSELTMEGMDDETLMATGGLVAVGVVTPGDGGTSSAP